jgi:hypothetical protein
MGNSVYHSRSQEWILLTKTADLRIQSHCRESTLLVIRIENTCGPFIRERDYGFSYNSGALIVRSYLGYSGVRRDEIS